MLLTAYGYSQSSLAEAMGIGRSAMSLKMSGKTGWSVYDLVNASRFLKVSTEQLLDDSLMRRMGVSDDAEADMEKSAVSGGLSDDGTPPSERASAEALENIHPFADDNGRTGRQILNMMLMQAGYEPIAIRHDAGSTYAGRLEQWQAYGDPVPLACMVADCVVREQCRIGKIVSDIRRGHPIAGHARGIRE